MSRCCTPLFRRAIRRGFLAWLLGIPGLAQAAPADPPAEPAPAVDAIDAETLLQQVERRYRNANQYESSGMALTRIIQPEDGTESSVGVEFSLRLARPRLYRIVWAQHRELAPSGVGAIWNDGDGAAMYLGDRDGWSTLPSDEVAFSAAAGASMGAAYLVPGLFFGLGEGESLLQRLEEVADHGPDTAAGRPCRIIAGTLPTGVEYRFWIAQDRPDIVQIETLLGGRTSDVALPALTLEKRARVLERMGLPDTPENQAKVVELMERARSVMRRVRGTSRQTHHGIELLRPRPTTDYAFDPPPEAQRTESVLAPATEE